MPRHCSAALFTACRVASTAGCTVGALALGRFVFLPFHRASLAKAGLPKQNDQTHFAAGDARAEEASFVLKVCEPPGRHVGGPSRLTAAVL